MLVPDFGPTMNVIAYSPFQDGVSAKAAGGTDRAIASEAAHKPTRVLRRSGAIDFSSGSVPPYILLCRCHRPQALSGRKGLTGLREAKFHTGRARIHSVRPVRNAFNPARDVHMPGRRSRAERRKPHSSALPLASACPAKKAMDPVSNHLETARAPGRHLTRP